MAQLTLQILSENSGVTLSNERRLWLYNSFGTTAAAAYTMFECTFSGGWRLYSRPLIEEVSLGFAVFWIMWVICVNFTTMRVVSALFLKQTLAVARVDDDRLALENMKRKNAFANRLRLIFEEADTSGDGFISPLEFQVMLLNSTVVA